MDGDVIYRKQEELGAEQVWTVGRARAKNPGLLVSSQHLFSLRELLEESVENVGQKRGNTGM